VKKTLVPGVEGKFRHRVVTADLVNARLPAMPAVLSTPSLLMVLEIAAHDAIAPHLDRGEASVGAGISLRHLAPTLCGDTVTATARVTAIDGKLITVQLEAHDSRQKIAEGSHDRVVIDLERFKERLRRQAGP
jgi:predicted thioesterase